MESIVLEVTGFCSRHLNQNIIMLFCLTSPITPKSEDTNMILLKTLHTHKFKITLEVSEKSWQRLIENVVEQNTTPYDFKVCVTGISAVPPELLRSETIILTNLLNDRQLLISEGITGRRRLIITYSSSFSLLRT